VCVNHTLVVLLIVLMGTMFSFQNSCRPCNALQLCGDLRQSKQLCYMDVQHNMNGLAEIDSGAGSFHSNLVHEPYPPF